MLLFRSVAFDIRSVVSFIFNRSVAYVLFRLVAFDIRSVVFHLISCICYFFDQLRLIFDQLLVSFNQLYMLLF